MQRGAFILFEGVDRCGKTTQVGMLNEHLSARCKTEQIRFPDRRSNVGKMIDSYLQSNSNLNDQSIHLLFSVNRWEQSDMIESKLAEGCNLVRICFIIAFERVLSYVCDPFVNLAQRKSLTVTIFLDFGNRYVIVMRIVGWRSRVPRVWTWIGARLATADCLPRIA
jgi:hypothetical protein